MRRRWHRGSRFSRTYWWSDAKFSFASVTGTTLGWRVSAYGYDEPKTPFRTLREAKSWVEKHVTTTPKRSTTDE